MKKGMYEEVVWNLRKLVTPEKEDMEKRTFT